MSSAPKPEWLVLDGFDTSVALTPSLHAVAAYAGCCPDELAEYMDPHAKITDLGQMHFSEFADIAGSWLGITDYSDRVIGGLEVIKPTIAVARAWSALGGKVGLLTNVGEGALDLTFEAGALPAELFDCVIESWRCGIAKPDPLIYKKAQSILGVSDPSKIIFADDSAKNTAGADDAGWRNLTFEWQNARRSAIELAQLCGIELSLDALAGDGDAQPA